MPGRLSFEFHLGCAQPPATSRRENDGPLRILVIGDFSGRRGSPDGTRQPLSSRRPLPVDVDTIETRLREIGPQVGIAGANEDGSAATLALRGLDDFHPDRLAPRISLLDTLRNLRERLDDPTARAEAGEALRRLLAASGRPPAPGPAAPAASAAGAESDTETLSRLLGASSSRPPIPPHAESAASALIRATVAPHVVAPAPEQVSAYRSALDGFAGDVLRRVLGDPAFRALEAIWRGLAWLVSGLEGDEVEWWMLDATRGEVTDDLLGHGEDLSATALHRLLVEAERDVLGGQRWTALLGDFYFGPGEDDARLLAALGVLAGACGGPFLSGADPALLGCRDAAALSEPARWGTPDAGAAEAWEAMRRTRGAAWLGLALPRLLLRLPYGPRTDPIETFDFDEAPDPTDPEAFLWGNPALAVVMALAQSFVEAGQVVRPDARLQLEGLPAFSYVDVHGQRRLLPCAEVLLPERAVEQILARGLIPLVSHRDLPVIQVAAFTSLALPTAPLSGPWSTG
jgi:type VI secretion system protein ImpC